MRGHVLTNTLCAIALLFLSTTTLTFHEVRRHASVLHGPVEVGSRLVQHETTAPPRADVGSVMPLPLNTPVAEMRVPGADATSTSWSRCRSWEDVEALGIPFIGEPLYTALSSYELPRSKRVNGRLPLLSPEIPVQDGDVVMVFPSKSNLLHAKAIDDASPAVLTMLLHGSDRDTPSELNLPTESFLEWAHETTGRIYVQNAGLPPPLPRSVQLLPIGLVGTGQRIPQSDAMRSLYDVHRVLCFSNPFEAMRALKDPAVLATTDFGPKTDVRRFIRDTFCGQHKWVRCRPYRRAIDGDGLAELVDLYEYRARSAFVFSPPGSGEDCHRTWEVLLGGSFPIVRASNLDRLFDGLPVLIVETFEEVTEDLLRRTYLEFSSRPASAWWGYQRLYGAYWARTLHQSTTS